MTIVRRQPETGTCALFNRTTGAENRELLVAPFKTFRLARGSSVHAAPCCWCSGRDYRRPRRFRFDRLQNGLIGSAAMIWDRGVRSRSRSAAASSATLL